MEEMLNGPVELARVVRSSKGGNKVPEWGANAKERRRALSRANAIESKEEGYQEHRAQDSAKTIKSKEERYKEQTQQGAAYSLYPALIV